MTFGIPGVQSTRREIDLINPQSADSERPANKLGKEQDTIPVKTGLARTLRLH
jgi:hypothetical protein